MFKGNLSSLIYTDSGGEESAEWERVSFDIAGEKVRELPSTREPFRWDSLDADLNEVPSGVYIIRVETPSGEQLFTKVAIIR